MQLEKKFVARLLGIDETEIRSVSGLSCVDVELTGFRDLLNDRLKERAEALAKVLTKLDDLGKIVRAHINIEYELHEFLFFAAPNPAFLTDFKSIDFSEIVTLALMLGLNPELKSGLDAVGNLRNKFAHRPDMKIREGEAENLIASLPPPTKQRARELMLRSSDPAHWLTQEAKAYFRVGMQLVAFFLAIFEAIASERHRIAFEKIQRMSSINLV